jgi:hypothetical protein
LLESKAENTAHEIPIAVETSITIINVSFYPPFSFIFKRNIVGKTMMRNSTHVPPIKPNALIMLGKSIAIPPAEATTIIVRRKCSHVLDCLFNLKSEKICSLHGAYSRVTPLNTFKIHPILPISIR